MPSLLLGDSISTITLARDLPGTSGALAFGPQPQDQVGPVQRFECPLNPDRLHHIIGGIVKAGCVSKQKRYPSIGNRPGQHISRSTGNRRGNSSFRLH